MSSDSKFNDARASLKDLAKKVETIDLSGSGLVGGKKSKTGKRAAKRKSPSKTRSTSAKRVKSRSSSAKKRSGSAKKKSSGSKKQKTTMNVNEHKLADNLIQLGVQLKNLQLEGGKRKSTRKSSPHKRAHKPLHM